MTQPDSLSSSLSSEAAAQIFRRTSDGVIIAAPGGTIMHVNPAAVAILAVTLDDLLGKPPAACFTNNLALINLFTRSGEQVLDVRLPRRRLAVGTATQLSDGSRMVMLRDVTEQRDLESRREALTNTIAHDLRNPINAMGGFAELVALSGPLNAEQKQKIDRVTQLTAKMREVIRDLVDLAWLEAGMPLQHVPVKLEAVILASVSECAAAARDRVITVATSIQSPMPVVMGDPDRLRSVIDALLDNAIQYSDFERMIVVHAWGDEREAYCSVADQGYGIADDELGFIFDRMYRGKDERVQSLPGVGLGLTKARRIVVRHGGDLWASSNLGKGSTFTFMLPAAQT